MAHGHVIADNRWIAVVGDVDQREVLNVGAPAYPNEINVAPGDAVEPETAPLANLDIAVQNRAGSDPGARMDDRALKAMRVLRLELRGGKGDRFGGRRHSILSGWSRSRR